MAIGGQKSAKNRQQKKAGFFECLRCRKTADGLDKEHTSTPEEAPTGSQSDYDEGKLSEEDPLSGEQNNITTKDKRSSRSAAKGGINAQDAVAMEAPPAARDSAFSGPPRYDWIDIVSISRLKWASFLFYRSSFFYLIVFPSLFLNNASPRLSGNSCCC